jgi:hypothetical protein
MQSTIYFTTDYGKKVSMTLHRDKWGEYSIRHMTINQANYTGKQIRTAHRETILVNYAAKHIDIDEHFADVQAENFRRHF